jgi:hypothetical protein
MQRGRIRLRLLERRDARGRDAVQRLLVTYTTGFREVIVMSKAAKLAFCAAALVLLGLSGYLISGVWQRPAATSVGEAGADPGATARAVAAEPESRPTATAPETVRSAVEAPRSHRLPNVRVQVTCEQKPVVDALVETFADSTPGTARTDEQGTCEVPVPLGPDAFRIRVTAAGCFHRQCDMQRWPLLPVALPHLVAMSGRVLDAESGEPLAGARIEYNHGQQGCRGCVPDLQVAGQGGEFCFTALPGNERCHFRVRADGHAVCSEMLTTSGGSGPLSHDFRLARGIEVRGRIVEAKSHLPLSDMTLETNGLELGRSGPDGRFSVRTLPEGDGSARLQVVSSGRCRVSVVIPESAWAGVEIVVPPAVVIRGVVKDAVGRPIAGARMHASRSARDRRPADDAPSEGLNLLPGTRVDEEYDSGPPSDSTGQFRTGGVVAGRAYLLMGYHPSFEAGKPPKVVIEPDAVEARCDIVMVAKPPPEALGSVTGKFLVDGKPCAAAVWVGNRTERMMRTAPDGRFRIDGLAPGKQNLGRQASVGANGTGVIGSPRRRTSSWSPAKKSKSELEMKSALLAIEGTVRRPDGSPAPDESVAASAMSDGSRVRLSATSDREGRYSIAVPRDEPRWTVSLGDSWTKGPVGGARGSRRGLGCRSARGAPGPPGRLRRAAAAGPDRVA